MRTYIYISEQKNRPDSLLLLNEVKITEKQTSSTLNIKKSYKHTHTTHTKPPVNLPNLILFLSTRIYTSQTYPIFIRKNSIYI